MSVAGSAESSAGVKAKKKRPDGTDISRYKNIRKWSYHQWAWEFLRRNTAFIGACKKVRSGEKSKQAVARRYGLKKFKDCLRDYSKSNPPQFSIESYSIWCDLEISNKKARNIKLNLWPGQMIIRMDLAATIEHVGAIDKQVDSALSAIKGRIEEFKKRYQELTKQHKPQDQTLGIYLRLLDLKDAGFTNLECGQILLKKKVQDQMSNDDLREDIKQRLKPARDMAKKNYKFLSVKDGSPPVEAEIPIEVW